jgi:hypothetical protein
MRIGVQTISARFLDRQKVQERLISHCRLRDVSLVRAETRSHVLSSTGPFRVPIRGAISIGTTD